jgi:transposase InsO family protein
VLRLRVAFPQNQKDEEMALWTFGRDQGHILYMRGAEHLRIGNDQLREVTERFPGTNLARYIHYCFGLNQARSFKDAVQGKVREPRPEAAIRELERARAFLSPGERHSSLDNITHGQTVDLLSDLYYRTEQPKEAKSVLSQTARYFTRMNVKPAVIEEIRSRAAAIEA